MNACEDVMPPLRLSSSSSSLLRKHSTVHKLNDIFLATEWAKESKITKVSELWKLENIIFGQKSWTNLKKVGAGEL